MPALGLARQRCAGQRRHDLAVDERLRRLGLGELIEAGLRELVLQRPVELGDLLRRQRALDLDPAQGVEEVQRVLRQARSVHLLAAAAQGRTAAHGRNSARPCHSRLPLQHIMAELLKLDHFLAVS